MVTPPDESADLPAKIRLQNAKLLALRGHLQRQLEQKQERIRALETELESRRNKVKAMQDSFSWKVTAGFRFLRRALAGKNRSENVPPSTDQVHASPAFAVISGCDETVHSNYPPGRYRFHGWCFAEDGRELFSVRARLTRTTFEAVYGLPRPDLTLRYPDKSGVQTSGWEVLIEFHSGDRELVLETCDASGAWVALLQSPLQVGLIFEGADYRKNIGAV